MFASGCADDSSSMDEPNMADLDMLYDCEDPDPIIQPLFGPGWDDETQSLRGEPQASYIVHTTQIMVDPDAEEIFDQLADDVIAQLMQTEGLIAIGFAGEPTCGFRRTTGVWANEAAMYRFVASGAHAQAMAMTRDVAVTARTTHFEVSAEELPLDWSELGDRIDEIAPGAY